ncbi:SNF2-related protein [Kandleria sp.]|uniref:SNF2-related protein n=1 Tax=Kandleria sp. TaxID=2774291 RepID=UPI001B6BA1BC|nr:SNF2-related protein [Kandleria sp.]MBP3276822.1 DEAD/DEAH box helicase family protein [Kandleria sp.]
MFRKLDIKSVYTSDENNIPQEFYIPVLKCAKTFDRTSAYFSAKALAMYTEGLEYFEKHGEKFRLVISKDISEDDYKEIKQGYEIRKAVTDKMINTFHDDLSLREQKDISNLSYLIAKGIVDVKIAFKTEGIFHDKCGILTDKNGDVICFRGSNNETVAAIDRNYESFQVTCSWLDSNGFYRKGIEKSQREFDKIWNNEKKGLIVKPAPDVIVNEIIKYNKGKIIMDEKLLKDNAVILDYDDQLILQVNTVGIDWLTKKTFYRTKLKKRVDRIENSVIYFKKSLTYRDCKRIDQILRKKITKYEYLTTKRYETFISDKELYIESRSRLGAELKSTDAQKFEKQYNEFKSVVNRIFERKLRDQQMKNAFFMWAMKKSGNFSVPGSGKTASALAVFAYLYEKKLVNKIVMIGPKNSFESWKYEFKACFGNNLKLMCYDVQNPDRKTLRDKKLDLIGSSVNCNLFLFNYERLESFKDELTELVSDKALLVFDEVHKVKRVNGQRASFSLEIAKYASYTIAMTGTPIPNTYLDLYNLLHILFNDEYNDFFAFDRNYLLDPGPKEINQINDKIQPFFCRVTKKALAVPDSNSDIINEIEVSENEQKLFDILRNKYYNQKFVLLIRILQLESNPSMILEKIDEDIFSQVFEYDKQTEDVNIADYTEDVKKLIADIKMTSKKKACISLVKQLVSERKKVIIWCIFRDSIRSLRDCLLSEGINAKFIMGDVDVNDRDYTLNQFKSGNLDVLITNPHTLAESISLHNVCHDAIYFEYSYNLVHLLQSKDRIHRLGLKKGQYTQYYYLQNVYNFKGSSYSLDQKIYDRLSEKEKTMIDAIENHELEPVYTSEEDIEAIFGYKNMDD